MKPRRILIFSLAYYPRLVGGAEVAVKEITDRIQATEVEFDMVTMAEGSSRSEKIGNVNVYRVGCSKIPGIKYFYILLAVCKARKLNKKLKKTLGRGYDATWSIMANYAGFAALFFKMSHPEVPFILTLQEGDPIEHIKKRVGILYPIFKKIFSRADQIQTISKFLATWAKDMGATCPIEVIPNGVDYDHFASTVSIENKKEIRKSLGLNDSDIVLVSAGRLVTKNAPDDLVRALGKLDNRYKLLLIGGGSPSGEKMPNNLGGKSLANYGADESSLKKLANDLSVADRVVFAGFISHEKLPRYLQSSDIFIRPSRSEGLGNAFLEAMAANLPVIAPLVGGITDFLVDGVTGLVCEINNPDSIVAQIKKYESDSDLKKTIIKNAQNLVREQYQWKNIVFKMADLFKEVFSKKVSNG